MASASSPIDLASQQVTFYYQYEITLKGATLETPPIVAHGTDNLLAILKTDKQDPTKTPFVTADAYVFEECLVSRDAIASIRLRPSLVGHDVSRLPSAREMVGHQP